MDDKNDNQPVKLPPLPRDNRKLDDIFRSGELPDIAQIQGFYYVRMLTGLPSLQDFGHRKFFQTDGKRLRGYNVVFKNLKWGSFSVENGICKELGGLEVVEINYNQPGNSFLTKWVMDYIRRIGDQTYLGRLNYFHNGSLRFLGYFTLTRS